MLSLFGFVSPLSFLRSPKAHQIDVDRTVKDTLVLLLIIRSHPQSKAAFCLEKSEMKNSWYALVALDTSSNNEREEKKKGRPHNSFGVYSLSLLLSVIMFFMEERDPHTKGENRKFERHPTIRWWSSLITNGEKIGHHHPPTYRSQLWFRRLTRMTPHRCGESHIFSPSLSNTN